MFFFQAEDGIRDSSVTGVQTCALPISRCCAIAPVRVRSVAAVSSMMGSLGRASPSSSPARSEERRVGKECRSRCSPYHYKKKHTQQRTQVGVEERVGLAVTAVVLSALG